MIAFRPSHVFESMGQLEESLLESALSLIQSFEGILHAVSQLGVFHRAPPDLTEKFPSVLHEYLKRFKAWKVPDEIKLTCRIKHALIALYQAEEHLPKDEPDDSKLKIEFRTQITRLRGKLQQIAGPQALIDFDAEYSRSGGKGGGGGGGGGSGGGGCSGGAYASLPGKMSNEQLAHELLLDPLFQLDNNGGTSLDNPTFRRIRESFHKAFWDSLADDFKLSPPCYVRALRVLREIRDGISDVAGQGQMVAIAAVIDVDFIEARTDVAAFEWEDFKTMIGGVVGIIRRVQAPLRDEETQTLWRAVGTQMLTCHQEDRPKTACKALEFLLDRVNALRIDAANAR
jgi:hypothetical protein